MSPTVSPHSPPLVIPPEIQAAADELARALAVLLAERWVRTHGAQSEEKDSA
jgi:hypothetical protein